MIWNRECECMTREGFRACQIERLRMTVKRVYDNVPFYRAKMQEAGLVPEDIRTLADLKLLPFTNKSDLRDNYPFGLFAVPMSEIVRVHASSGTTGKPTTVGYTRGDINMWSEIVARCMTMAGVSKEDTMQIAYGYGLFTGGFGIHYGAEKVGCAVIPISGGNTRRQLQTMVDFGSTVLACTPSYALHIADTLEDNGFSLSQLKLRHGIFGAEPWTEGMRRTLEQKLNISAHDIYGLSEVMGPGVAADCQYHDGLHINEDHFIPEIIDPKTGEPLPEGETGELVFTTLTKEGLPLIRYRTHDLSSLNYEPCKCGRTTVRMKKIIGRSDDMLIIRGVNLFPSRIEELLTDINETTAHYMLYVDRVNNLDTLELQVETDPSYFIDKISDLQALTRKIQNKIQGAIGLSIKVKLVEPKTIERSEGKAKRVIDRRKFE